MKKIYLACPYMANDRNVMRQRFDLVSKKAGELMARGLIVFSPLSHSVPIDERLPKREMHDFWLNQDKYFLDWADEIWVLALEGWKESKGVNWEIAYAKEHGKPVKIIPNDHWY